MEAARRWRIDGTPDRPGAWLLTTARRRAIDRMRRAQRFEERIPALVEAAERPPPDDVLADDQLALLFGCCHPALTIEAQVALTLRAVAGLSTTQIAHAFLVPEATMAKRLVRAKHKVRAAGIPFAIPEGELMHDRLTAVCAVVYAIFTEGHASTSGATLVRGSLCDEAIWLAETLAELAPREPELHGLAALCLLTDARRATRVDSDGQPVLLANQDRSRWDRTKIERGLSHLHQASPAGRHSVYRLQAIIAAVHTTAPTWEETEWRAIVAVYDVMLEQGGGPVVELNRAAALAELKGPAVGLAQLDSLADRGLLGDYHYFHSARAELLRRLDRFSEALTAYERAIEWCQNDSERDWLQGRHDELTANEAGRAGAS